MTYIKPEDFVVAWTTSATLDDFCNTTDLSKSAAKQRAKRMRAAGVKLKHMPNHRTPKFDQLRVAQLNSLVNKHKGGS